MTDKQDVKDMLEVIRRDRAALELLAEVDPAALRLAAVTLGSQYEIWADVALRVIEDELGVRPLPGGRVSRTLATLVDQPPIEG